MGPLPPVTAVVLAIKRTMPENLEAMKRDEGSLPWVWIILGTLVLLGIGVAIWLRGRQKDTQVDRKVLTARVQDRGFTVDEEAIIQKIASKKGRGRASDLVPKLRKYDEALEAFLEEEAEGLSEEEREALAETLSGVRHKLGFKQLADYRHIPSTREVPIGTAMMSRPAGRQDAELQAAVMHHVDELKVKVQFIADESKKGAGEEAYPPTYEPGDRVEFFFAHGPHRRCRFTTGIAGRAEGKGWVFPIEHVKVENIALSRSSRNDISLDAEVVIPGGAKLSVVVLELTGSGATLAAPLPETVRRGTLRWKLPGSDQALEADVIRPAVSGEDASPVERSRLRFRALPEDTRQKIFQFIRQSSATQPA